MAEEQPITGDLADSIAMLEQILEVMPGDIDALRTLYKAYCQCDQRDRAFEYLSQMANVVIDNGDSETAKFVFHELGTYSDDRSSEVSDLVMRLRALGNSSSNSETTESKPHQASAAAQYEADINEELSLAWQLYEDNQLSQDDYSTVLHDITEVSSKDLDVPVSVLHVLNDRGYTNLNRVINHMSSRLGVPCISLAQYSITDEVAARLPLEMAMHEGALPFALFGEDLLIAVLNPSNRVLVDKAEKLAGCRCHTYLVTPEDYDETLKKLQSMVIGAAA